VSLPNTGGRTTGLPQTGSSAALVALLGAGLLGLGGVTMIAGRRRGDSIDADDAS
jgi:LPXTG-motif cell wall-anchored protein